MSKKKKIGISYTTLEFSNYMKWFTESDLGNDLELVELSFQKNNIQDIYSCDGFVLTGGVDVHPSLYNEMPGYENAPAEFQISRDLFETIIYHYSQAYKLPLLGICRGLQLVNVLEGGKLIQDLGEKGNEIHRKNGNQDKIHEVMIIPESSLNEIAGIEKTNTNSAHHQLIDPKQLGRKLKVNAINGTDQSIEGIEFDDKANKGFMLCVQWHPERMENKENNALSQNLKQTFLQEVRNTNMKKMDIINPATETIITSLNEDDEETVSLKLASIKQGQQKWENVSLKERIDIIRKFSVLLSEEIEILADSLTAEVGKPLQQSRNEINGARTRIQWLTDHAEKYLADEIMSNANGLEEKISYEPLGVVCNISAWNYPYLVGTNVFVPALLTGNAVMYKPSEYASLTGLHIERLLKKAGVPENVFQTAIGAADVGAILLNLPFDGYFFTGSYKTGQSIYQKVAAKMVVCQCELGGKDPLYVADDVEDINAVAIATADGAFYNNGQSCCAVERIYVHEKVYDAYINAFVKEVKSWKIGNPRDENVYIGAITRKNQLAVIEQQVNEAKSKGAVLLTGGKRMDRKGFYFEPTVLVNVNHEMSVMNDESFGPVIGIMKVKDDDEAVMLMGDTEFGLTASVYSSDKKRAENLLKQMDTGTAYWNCCDRVSAALPWSGRKHSGFGTTLSFSGLRAFTKMKSYHLKS